MKTKEKIKFYQLRADGISQTEAAKILGVSDRTCRRWEKEARIFSEESAETAKKLYATTILNQKSSTTAVYAMLEGEIVNINYNELSPERKLDFFLKYGRRLEELQNKAPAAEAEAMKLDGLAEMDSEEAQAEVLKMQTMLYNMAAAGEITDEQARKKIALLTELRKSIDANAWG